MGEDEEMGRRRGNGEGVVERYWGEGDGVGVGEEEEMRGGRKQFGPIEERA